MGSTTAWSSTFARNLHGAGVLLALAVSPLVVPGTALAQHADAGTEQKAATPPPAPAEPPRAGEPSGVLAAKAIDPTQLSEGTRARLAERAAGRHASSTPASVPNQRPELDPAATPSVPPYRPRIATSEPLRRGQARMRVQALETDEGVTLLSNRIQIPEPRITAAVARRPLPQPEPPAIEEPVALGDDAPRVTETHSLRPLSSRSTKAKNTSTGLGWLLWPFVLFVTAGAVVGTLWFRKKTE